VLPLTETIGDWSITLEGRDYTPEENPNGDWQVASADYLETMRIPLLAGRFPTAADGPDAPPVAVINQAMADRYWPGENALGKRFHLGTLDQPWIEIIGIIPNIRHNAVIEDAREEMVLVHSQFMNATGERSSPQRGMTLVVRTSGEPLAMLPAVRAEIRQLDPRLPVADVRRLDDVAAAALAQPRFTALLLTTFALLALLLAAIGLYGVISFMAARRTNEMGVRLALGARRSDIVRIVMGEGIVLAAVGVLVGIAASAVLTRLLEAQLFGVARLDAATFLAVPTLLLLVAGLASYLPARRAAAVSPVAALSAD
jgi:predicted permease